MQGLLDFLKTPEGQGLLAAGFGYAAGAHRGTPLNNLGRGGMAGLLAFGQAQDRQVETAERAKMGQYRDAQMANLQSEMEARRLAAEEAKRKRDLINNLLGGGPLSTPAAPGQLGSGSFGVVPTAAGQPDIPQTPPAGARVPNLTFDQLAALKMHGMDLVDLHKYANDPRKLESGSTYENRVTGKREYLPRLPEGMAPGSGGQYGFVPGYEDSMVRLERRKAGATEGVKADLDPVQVVGPGGASYFVPRSQVVAPRPAARSAPADADRFAILSQELERARASGNATDIRALEAEISRLPASARTANNQSGLAVPGFQATPTSAQAADAAAAKERAVADAKAESERQAGKTKKSDSATEMLGNIGRAKALLQAGATGSLIGAGVDKGMGIVGMSTPTSQNADRLETISGWLVANVPRMEGPQSNYDVQNYQVMAGRVGDRSYPIPGRLAALEEIERIQKKYAHLNQGEAQAPVRPQTTPATPPKPMKGMVRNGYRFKGGDPADKNNWEKQ